MPDIFISYSRHDKVVADRICEALDRAGITYFIDRQGIVGGMEFPEVLAENIISSKLFLFLASKHSYKSRFTNNEITFAFNEKPKNSILPYIIDGSQMPKTMRFIFSGINWRTIDEHPIEPILIDDLLNLLGRTRETLQSKSINETYISINNIRRIVIPHNKRKYILVFVMFALFVVLGYFVMPRIIIESKYDYADWFNEGLARVQLNGKSGFVSRVGKEIVSLKYDDVSFFREGLAWVKLNGKYGFVDNVGTEITPLKYDNAWTFSEGLAAVELNNKCGFIDKRGREIIPLKYDVVHFFIGGVAQVKFNGKWFYIDKEGNRVK